MADKKALEAYRVRQFGQSLFKDMREPTSSTQAEQIQPDTTRVVAHFDVDAFYCQVEELRRPGLSHRPMGVSCSPLQSVLIPEGEGHAHAQA